MAVRALSGYDPDTGWPPDDSTGVQWQNDVELPGQFQGGGAGFGPGGFQGSPKLTAPASGPPPGISLSNGAGGGASVPPEVTPPTNSPLRPGASPAIRTPGFGPATDATVPEGGGGLFSRIAGWLPSILANPVAAGVGGTAAISAAGWPAEKGRAKLTVDPRIDAAGSGGFDVSQPLGTQGGPDSFSPDAGQPTPNFVRPEAPITRTFPSWPTPPASAPAAATPAPGGMPWAGNNYGRPAGAPIGSPAPAVPPPRPRVVRAAGPAAVRQQPNLGAYGGSPFTTVDRPNANPGIGGGMLGGGVNSPRGQGGAPVATALDLSRLFGGGQPAPAAAAPVRAPVAAPVYRQPSIRMVPPAIPIGGGAGNVMEAPSPRRKSSSTSQGGGY